MLKFLAALFARVIEEEVEPRKKEKKTELWKVLVPETKLSFYETFSKLSEITSI